MKLTGQEVIDDRYAVTTGYGRDLDFSNRAVIAVTDIEDDIYRCSDALPESSMDKPLESTIRYLEKHGHETPDRPVDKEAVPHRELQVVADNLTRSSSQAAKRKSKMLDHEKSPHDF
ncbi:MAG: hypothetical protein ABEJ91_01310 [Candidatus Nanohaloarchaea archaeon]